jgi:hypothetical protein
MGYEGEALPQGPWAGHRFNMSTIVDIRDDIEKGIHRKDVTLDVHRKVKRIYEADPGKSYPYELPDDPADPDTPEIAIDMAERIIRVLRAYKSPARNG